MPQDWKGEYIPQNTDNISDVIGFGDMGGVGQHTYHTFRFKDYEYETGSDDVLCLKSIVNENMLPDLSKSFSGKELFMELYNLGRSINDFSVKRPFNEQIIDFCKNVAHPYYIDELYLTLTEDFDVMNMGEQLERDAMFSIHEFMRDLGRFYQTAQYYFALRMVCNGDGETAFNLYQEGKFFEGLPFFERYKSGLLLENHTPEEGQETFDEDENFDIVAAMKAENKKYEQEHRGEERVEPEWFKEEPFDHYEDLRDKLIDIIPDFRIRLKVNPKNGQVVFAADVHSVFDIAWYTLARMIVDFGPPEEGGTGVDTSEGTLVTCLHCGEAFIRRSNRQQYCNKKECKRAQNALRQRKYRERQKLKASQEKGCSKNEESR